MRLTALKVEVGRLGSVGTGTFLQRTRFEGIAERKLRRRQLTEDGNVEISGWDLPEGLRLVAGAR
jgi:hypothetical protein